MAITVKDKQFRLDTKSTTYLLSVFHEKHLAHLYWGATLPADADLTYLAEDRVSMRPSFTTKVADSDTYFTDLPQEFPTFGTGDHRTPVFHAAYQNGSTVSEFTYQGYEIITGKPKLEGLPATYAEEDSEAQTLVITLKDLLTGCKAVLSYSVFEEYDAITRSIRYENDGGEAIELLHAGSMGIDLWGQDYEILHLHGDWLRERHMETVPVSHATYLVDSKRGHSSHMQNPFVALLRSGASEYSGEVFGFSLVYSGSFQAAIEGGPSGGTRVVMGINPFGFRWDLAPGASFQTPEVVMVYSGEGLDGMSGRYHKLYRERLCRGIHRERPRPLVINNWEATGTHFTEEKILEIAEAGGQLGLELFVLDDGWFGKRDRDDSSLGDWFTHKEKLPLGLDGLVKAVNGFGMQFGLWFEPEMISPDSELYRAHPDWCLHAEGRPRTTTRDQLVLDYSKPEVCDYIIDVVSAVLRSAHIEYVKWDCNRNINETARRSQLHEHMLGVYRVMEKLTGDFPDILFESCSGGGGRFDPGMLYYMPQTWTSDNTDPIARLRIQYGTSVVYPPSAIVAHIGKIPVGIEGHNPLMHTCAMAAMGFNFGFEQDLSLLSEGEQEQARSYAATYKEIRELVQFGEFHRLENPFTSAEASWMTVSPDQSQAVAFFFQTRRRPNPEERRVRLRGLDANRRYLCDGRTYYGAELMQAGIRVPSGWQDYEAIMMRFEEVK